jgi:methanogenic corrinoid protein MtbC1
MRITAKVEKPEDVTLTVTATATVEGWREVVAALKQQTYRENWTAAKFCELLSTQLRAVERDALGQDDLKQQEPAS